MGSPRQVELPLWTVQLCCIASYLPLLGLTAATLYGQQVPQAFYCVSAFLSLQTTGWVLRVPPTMANRVSGLLGKSDSK